LYQGTARLAESAPAGSYQGTASLAESALAGSYRGRTRVAESALAGSYQGTTLVVPSQGNTEDCGFSRRSSGPGLSPRFSDLNGTAEKPCPDIAWSG
jgi:hypothetical protein